MTENPSEFEQRLLEIHQGLESDFEQFKVQASLLTENYIFQMGQFLQEKIQSANLLLIQQQRNQKEI